MKLSFILLIQLIFCSVIFGQNTYDLLIELKSKENKEELIGATAYILELQKGAIANEKGILILENIPEGKISIVFSYTGMLNDTLRLELNEDKSIEFLMRAKKYSSQVIEIWDSTNNGKGIQRLKSIDGTAIYASKKTELIKLDEMTFAKAINNSRQVYAKVSGLNIWESDGAGVQLGIGGRGLSPNRNSNFNTRQNGYDISADALGYPESYYSPPIEAVERIEVVRGAASLQYGTQFGGLLNFKFKEGDKKKKFGFHTRQTVGSFGLFSSFNSVGGTIGKANYYGFYQYKRSKGFRPNSSLNQHTAYFGTTIKVNKKFSVKPEFTHTNYLAQQPGGLTDTQFNTNPRQSNRERNWFKVNWNLMALTMDYELFNRNKKKLTLNNRTFGLIAGRDALGNLDNINQIDFSENRNFLSDEFNNFGNETRLLYRYEINKQPTAFLLGARYYQGKTFRKQGDGNDGKNPDFYFLNPDKLEGSNFVLPSKNVALFTENLFNLNVKWSITPGVRFEYINTKTSGYYRQITRDLADNVLTDSIIYEQDKKERSFLFLGLGTSYRPNVETEIYANFSQNYRAINFNDIRVNVGNLVVDENLTDEKGFNLDLGIRGRAFNTVLEYDVTLYHLSYNDRIGTILTREPNPEFGGLVDRIVRKRTNIADAKIYGLESVVEWHILKSIGMQSKRDTRLSIFSNFSYTYAKYKSNESEIDGNDVELVPEFILKTGLNFSYKNLDLSAQYGFTKSHFSDASNAIQTASSVEGIIPSYQIIDLSARYQFKKFEFETGINNVLNEQYFTRRASGYPGPGIIPSSGRNFYLTVGFKL